MSLIAVIVDDILATNANLSAVELFHLLGEEPCKPSNRGPFLACRGAVEIGRPKPKPKLLGSNSSLLVFMYSYCLPMNSINLYGLGLGLGSPAAHKPWFSHVFA